MDGKEENKEIFFRFPINVTEEIDEKDIYSKSNGKPGTLRKAIQHH